ncbi:Serine protease snake [Orchesella cincta]|uniref:Serine protease snake n=1 Tax=Orchesella cincta TaxID=48709 RepID=A0A1D2N8N4_ORCCI|nr:Serine protease snake [Orchesella cincta]
MIIIKYAIFLLTSGLSATTSNPSCNLENDYKGQCQDIRTCPYQVGRLRVGAPVKKCDDSASDVCCPIQKSKSEEKCEEWRQMLYTPSSYDQPKHERVVCASESAIRWTLSGTTAYPFEFPHVVALGYGTNLTTLKLACGATLISEKYLLTAAHCVMHRLGKPSYAILGDGTLDPRVAPGNPYQKLVFIEEHVVHPKYIPPFIYHDIALLRLSASLDLNRYVLPACISTPLKAPRRNSNVEACGWGIRDDETTPTNNNIMQLQVANISTIGQGTCNKIYEDKPDKNANNMDGLLKSQFCATGENEDICRSDSGGGVFLREEQCLFHIVGITSLGSTKCGLASPTIYTNVASYQDWIESIVWEAGEEPR